MRSRHTVSFIALVAMQPLLWAVAASTHPEPTVPTFSVAPVGASPGWNEDMSPQAERENVFSIYEFALDFIAEISRGFQTGDYTGAVIRLLIIVEVLIGALGFAACATVWGKGKADLVYRIVDVMGALFLIIAFSLLAMALT